MKKIILLMMIFVSLGFGGNITLQYPDKPFWGTGDDYTLPATPSTNKEEYKKELLEWIEQHNSSLNSTDIEKYIEYSFLETNILKDLSINITNQKNEDEKFDFVHKDYTIIEQMRDLVFLESFKKSILQWENDYIYAIGTAQAQYEFKDIASQAKKIFNEYKNYSNKNGFFERIGNPLTNVFFGTGKNSYGNFLIADGIVEGTVEGLAVDFTKNILNENINEAFKQTKVTMTDPTTWKNIGIDLAKNISLNALEENKIITPTSKVLIDNVFTASMGIVAGGTGLIFAPAQIYYNTFSSFMEGYNESSMGAYFTFYYYFRSNYQDKKAYLRQDGSLNKWKDMSVTSGYRTLCTDRYQLQGIEDNDNVAKVLCNTKYYKGFGSIFWLEATSIDKQYSMTMANLFMIIKSLDIDALKLKIIEQIEAKRYYDENKNKLQNEVISSIPQQTPSTLSITIPNNATLSANTITANIDDEISLSFDEHFYFKDGITNSQNIDKPIRIFYKSGYNFGSVDATWDSDTDSLKFVVNTDQPFEIVKVEYPISDDEYISAGLPTNWKRVEAIEDNTNTNNDNINLTDGLVAHYEFEDNANDSSGNGNDGTEYGGVSYVDGVIGKAGSFDGDYNNYIRIAHKSSLNINGNYSFSYWVNKGEDTGNTQVLFSKGRDCENSYFSKNAGASFSVGYGQSWCDGKGLIQSFAKNEWHLVTVIINNDVNKLIYFLDGIFKEEITVPTYTTNNSYDLIIGRHDTFNDGTSSFPYPVNGKIDDFRIYNRALNDSEVKALYDLGKPQEEVNLKNGLVAYYEFEDNANDSSGNGNDGTEYGGVSYVDGVIGKAGSFDGTGKIEIIDDKETLAPKNLTISGWINRKGDNIGWGSQGMVLYKGNYEPVPNMAYAIQIYDETFELSSRSDTSGASNITSPTITNKWYYFTSIYNNNTKKHKLYINGSLINEVDFNNEINQNSEKLSIGSYAYNSGYYYNGLIDDLRIYNRALNESEIQALYELGTTTTEDTNNTTNTDNSDTSLDEDNTTTPSNSTDILDYTVTSPSIDDISTYYTDLPNGIKYQSDIYFATLKGIVHGYPSTTDETKREFRPADNASLAETLKMILLSANNIGLIELPVSEYFYKSYPIWSMPYYTYARNSGAIDTNKNDLSVIYPTREDIARVLVKALGLEDRLADFVDIDTIDIFDDEDDFSSTLSLRYAKISKAYGLFMTETQARPSDTITRGELASIITKLYMMPSANIKITPNSIEYGEDINIDFTDKKAEKIENNTLLDSSDEVTARFAINQSEQNSTTINTDKLNIGTNTITAIVSNSGVNNFISKYFDVNFTDSDHDGVQDQYDIWQNDSRYSKDENSNGIPDILDTMYNLNDKTKDDTITIEGVEVDISDIIDDGGYTPPITSLAIPKGWNLISANIDDLNSIPTTAKVLWQYKDKKWKAYSNRSSITKLLQENNYATIDSIKNSDGTWILADESFDLQTKPNTTTTHSYGNRWTLNGTDQTIQSNSIECNNGNNPHTVWKYEDDGWFIYSSKIKNFNSYTIYSNEGFWVDCR